jgi:hypothetical protein
LQPYIYIVVPAVGCGTSHKSEIYTLFTVLSTIDILKNSIKFTHKKFIYRVKGACIFKYRIMKKRKENEE